MLEENPTVTKQQAEIDVRNAMAALTSIVLPEETRPASILHADDVRDIVLKYQISVKPVSSSRTDLVSENGIIVAYPQKVQTSLSVVLAFIKADYMEQQDVPVVIPQDPDWKTLYDLESIIKTLNYHLSPHQDQVVDNLFSYIYDHVSHIPKQDGLVLNIKPNGNNIYINPADGTITYPKGISSRTIDLVLVLGCNSAELSIALRIVLEATNFPDVEAYSSSTQVAWQQVYKKQKASITLGNSISEKRGDGTGAYQKHNVSFSSGNKYSIKMHSTNFIASEFKGVYNGPVKLLLLTSDQDEWGIGKLPEDAFFQQEASANNSNNYEKGYVGLASNSSSSPFVGRNYWCLAKESTFWAAYVYEIPKYLFYTL